MTELFAALERLGIRAGREAIEPLLTHAQKSKLSPAQLLEALVDLEQRERDARNLARRTKMATLGSISPLDRFDWLSSSAREFVRLLQKHTCCHGLCFDRRVYLLCDITNNRTC
ncbi:ATP-binding protein [Chondromyces crocatus]|uniref:IstB-like ATP-binding domain-containing protein n=1 Tax=Chondromyces crocatus TaxID=52 RepID=A0A0K1ESI8_CHOCO|nr:ATP-binding protein [Chondromyces crocatus]AKT43568.1 uncharacterized protein CMC5_078000 [Chondromyces crocatus]